MKEKMICIFNEMSDITLEILKRNKEAKTALSEDEMSMVSATLQMYSFIADNHHPELFPE